MFKLTEEQINDIIENYGGSKKIINDVERRLNLIGVIEDEEDYLDVVIAVIAQKETIKLKLENCQRKDEQINVYMSTDDIIQLELNRKYNNFEDSSERIKQKMKSFNNQKIRHN